MAFVDSVVAGHLYSVKPLDLATVKASCRVTGGRVVIVEDHHPEGGLASAVLEPLAAAGEVNLHLSHLAVRTLPGSGSPEELLDRAGLTAPQIAAAARELIAASSLPPAHQPVGLDETDRG